MITKLLERYNFTDDHGHKLELCTDYHALLQMADYGMHVYVSNGKDDTCKDCGYDIRHPIHVRCIGKAPILSEGSGPDCKNCEEKNSCRKEN